MVQKRHQSGRNGLDVETLYYASLLDREGMKPDHSSCIEEVCLAGMIDESTYETKHVEKDCKRPHIALDTTRITSLLQNGQIPAIVFHPPNGSSQSASIEVVESTSQPYVAISHVWSDGLGNTRANSLPRCQLQRLRDMAMDLPKRDPVASKSADNKGEGKNLSRDVVDHENGPPIWIDSLCVPLEREGRKLALIAMRKTYQEADTVLVLDGELQQATFQCDWQEICVRIGISTRSRRLWPLQEAALAMNRLCFQFSGRSIDIDHTLSRQGVDPKILNYRTDLNLALSLQRSIPPFSGEDTLTELIYLGQSLLFRSTSKPADETFCLASILGLDVGRLIAHSSAERRMQEFFSLLETIPSNILFLDAPKLHVDGYRWAPRTFLTKESNLVNFWYGQEETPIAHLDSHGLRASLPGYIIRIDRPLEGRGIWVRDIDGTFLFLIYSGINQEWFDEVWKVVLQLREIVLITQNSTLSTAGFLASIKHDRAELESDMICVTYLCNVEITPVKDIIGWENIKPETVPAQCIRKLGSEQRWCIR